ncbi:MAG: type I methionyl aminopeptidase [Aquificaceae bacterium]
MVVELYSFKEIEKIKRACDVVVEVLQVVSEHVKPGVSTWELDIVAREETKKRGARPAFLNYKPPFSKRAYPAAICTSLNSAVVHGLPKKGQTIKEEDLVSLDFGAIIDGYAGDSALTLPVGKVDNKKEALLRATKEALEEAVKVCVVGNWLSDVVEAIHKTAEKYGMHPVRGLGGHGIGRKIHEEPFIPNNRKDMERRNVKLRQGMVIAIEPMFALGTEETTSDSDGWTVLTADGSPSAHFEYTVAITKEGPMVLTEFKDG